MSLLDVPLLREYRSYKNNVVKEFYIPVLKEANKYQRAVGFFTSDALIEISKGISGLILNGGSIELIVSPILNKSDIAAIEEGYDQRQTVENAIIREFHEPKDDTEKERLAWISYLIEIGKLDIMVAFTKKKSMASMFHEKMGIISDADGNTSRITDSTTDSKSGLTPLP